MGCNMCVAKRPEEHYRIMFQKRWSDSVRPMDRHGNTKVRGKRSSQVLLNRSQNSQDSLQQAGSVGRNPRRKGCVANVRDSASIPSITMVTIPACVDNGTQTEISLVKIGNRHLHHHRGWRGSSSPPPPPSPVFMGSYGADDLSVFDFNDYLDASNHDVDKQDSLEYEEVQLYKSRQQEKLGLTVCYRTDEEEDLGIYVGEVNPNSIAAKTGRIKEGDRILQINGVDVQNREEAVAILSREDSINFYLLLARPDLEDENTVDSEKDVQLSLVGGEFPSNSFTSSGLPGRSLCVERGSLARPSGEAEGGREGAVSKMDMEEEDDEGEEEEKGEKEDQEELVPLPPLVNLAPLLSNSQDLDSGVGRTDYSTRCEESSEHDLLGDQTSGCNTNTTNTPGSIRRFRAGLSPRLSPRPSPGYEPSPRTSPSPGHGRGDATPPLFYLRDLQLSYESLDRAAGGGAAYSPHHHHHLRQPYHHHHHHHHYPSLEMLMPGLTEQECQRYQELLEIKGQFERSNEECQREEMEAKEHGTRNKVTKESEPESPSVVADINCYETLGEHQMALIEEEIRHLEFKCRNILRAQKMQQLRERCLKAWMMEEETGHPQPPQEGVDKINDDEDDPPCHELSAINELPEGQRWEDRDSSSAYNTGGESCQSTPLVSTEQIPPLQDAPEQRGKKLMSPPLLSFGYPPPLNSLPGRLGQDGQREQRPANLTWFLSPRNDTCSGSNSAPSTPSRFLNRDTESSSRGTVADRRWSSRAAPNRHIGRSVDSSPYFSRRHQSHNNCLDQYQSCVTLTDSLDPVRDDVGPEGKERGVDAGSSGPVSPRSVNSAPCGLEDQHAGASRLGLALPLRLAQTSPTASPQRMEWKVKIRSDGTRYVAKRPVRDRLLKARAIKIREERSGMTTDDDAASEMKQGRYWSKEERKQQLLRAREYRRRREFMMQSRLHYLQSQRDPSSSSSACSVDPHPSQYIHNNSQQNSPSHNILQVSQKKITKKRNRRILDNWITIQELLAQGLRSPDGKKIYNPQLSVTTV